VLTDSSISAMMAVNISETLVSFYQTARHSIPEDSSLHIRRRENLKSHLTSDDFGAGFREQLHADVRAVVVFYSRNAVWFVQAASWADADGPGGEERSSTETTTQHRLHYLLAESVFQSLVVRQRESKCSYFSRLTVRPAASSLVLANLVQHDFCVWF
jgi:hypothetical protein